MSDEPILAAEGGDAARSRAAQPRGAPRSDPKIHSTVVAPVNTALFPTCRGNLENTIMTDPTLKIVKPNFLEKFKSKRPPDIGGVETLLTALADQGHQARYAASDR